MRTSLGMGNTHYHCANRPDVVIDTTTGIETYYKAIQLASPFLIIIPLILA